MKYSHQNNLVTNKIPQMLTKVCGSLAVFVLVGCQSMPKPTYVSSSVYKDYTCAQLHDEYRRVNHVIRNTSNTGDFLSTTGIGIGLHGGSGGIYPTVSVGMGANRQNNNPELSRLLGEREAMMASAKFKGCDFPITHKKQ